MDRIPVQSKMLISVGYDPEVLTLEIEFDNGVYQYFGIPQSLYDELINTSSKGSYFLKNIRNAGFSCKKV